MADSKKYYYMRVKENFFDTDDMMMLEALPNGYAYANILLKLYLKSLKSEGRLLYKDRIPYNENMISTITRHNIDIVKSALKIFEDLHLIEKLDNGAIYMLDIQNFIGRSSDEADRKRDYRNKIDSEKKILLDDKKDDEGQMSGQNSIYNYIYNSNYNFDYSSNIINKYDSIILDLFEGFYYLLLRNNDKSKIPTINSATFEKWLNSMKLLNEKDGYDFDTIKNVMKWSQEDKFWKANILSLPKLREKFQQLYLQSGQKTNNVYDEWLKEKTND
jgi:predicted phage replisome organizer